MPDVNITQLQPEIPNAGNPPQRVTDSPVPSTPFSPAVMTSSIAREQAKKDLKRLSEITGINYQF